MLKLNSDYSDYTDETDAAYPLGKAINASTSESYDGTPLLESFMNDLNAAHIATYKKAYGNTTGISGEADTQVSSQFADAVEKLVNDKVTGHSDTRGTNAHGATVEATAGQLMARDEYGNSKVASPIDDGDAANKGYVDAETARAEGVEGALSSLSTSDKATLVAAINEVLGLYNGHKDNTNNPHSVTGAQLAGAVPTNKIGDSAVTADKIANGAVTVGKVADASYEYARLLYGVCSTAANVQEKSVTIANLKVAAVKAGMQIKVTFENGSSYGDEWGQCYGLTGETGNASENTIREAAAPKIKVVCGDGDATAYPVTVAGQLAGEGFVASYETHTFTLVRRTDLTAGYAWEDETAINVYCSKTRNYSKKRDGMIDQFILKPAVSENNYYTVQLTIPYSNINYLIQRTVYTSNSSAGAGEPRGLGIGNYPNLNKYINSFQCYIFGWHFENDFLTKGF